MLDFTQVVVLDYSCADEAVARLMQRYNGNDRPAEVYFIGALDADEVETTTLLDAMMPRRRRTAMLRHLLFALLVQVNPSAAAH